MPEIVWVAEKDYQDGRKELVGIYSTLDRALDVSRSQFKGAEPQLLKADVPDGYELYELRTENWWHCSVYKVRVDE